MAHGEVLVVPLPIQVATLRPPQLAGYTNAMQAPLRWPFEAKARRAGGIKICAT